MSRTLHLPLETPVVELFSEVGVLTRQDQIPNHLELFVEQAEDVLGQVRRMVAFGELPAERGTEQNDAATARLTSEP